MVDKELVIVGMYYEFKDATRRVEKIENGQVHWVYADRKKRFGKFGGSQRIKHFANEAIEMLDISASMKVAMKDGFQGALKPRSKAEKWFVAISFIFFALAGQTVIGWWFK